MGKISKKITRHKVAEILGSGVFNCEMKVMGSEQIEPYDGCMQNLYRILDDGETTLSIADESHEAYHEGKRTIIMHSPYVGTVYIICEE